MALLGRLRQTTTIEANVCGFSTHARHSTDRKQVKVKNRMMACYPTDPHQQVCCTILASEARDGSEQAYGEERWPAGDGHIKLRKPD